MNYKPIASVDFLVVHCSATTPDMDVGAKEIERWHKEQGYFAIGYHYVIRRNGAVEKGRPNDQPGAHVAGHNHNSLGICMVGGVKWIDLNRNGKREVNELNAESNFTPEQFDALHKLLHELHAKHPSAEILGHRDIERRDGKKYTKACPSFDVPFWLENRPL